MPESTSVLNKYIAHFLQSNWYNEPEYFYDYATAIDFSNINIITNIVNNLRQVFCVTSRNYVSETYNINTLYKMQDIETLFVTDIIEFIGYSADKLVKIDGSNYSFATMYLYEVCEYATQHHDNIYKQYMTEVYYEGLKELRHYIKDKEKAYEHFNELAEMYKPCCISICEYNNELNAPNVSNLAKLYNKFAKLFE